MTRPNDTAAAAAADDIFAGSHRSRGARKVPETKAARDRFLPAGFFMLRSPALPVALLRELGAAPGDAAQARRLLEHLLRRPDVVEAVRVASPTLTERIDEWRNDPASPKHRKTEQALMRYLARMCSRATPFGLFAGVSWGTIGAQTMVRVARNSDCRRVTRLDSKHLYALADELERDPQIAEHLLWRANTSLYKLHTRLRFAELGPDENAKPGSPARRYKLSALDLDPTLEATLAIARDGVTLEALREHLVSVHEAEPDEAAQYVAELVASQVLVSDLAPPLTCMDGLGALAQRLARVPTATAAAAQEKIAAMRAAMQSMDASVAAPQEAAMTTLAALLGRDGVPAKAANLVQVDMFKPGEFTLAEDLTANLCESLTKLARVSSQGWHRLDSLKHAFFARFENREVPLAQVLDPESGLGFGEDASAGQPALLNGLHLNPNAGSYEAGQGGHSFTMSSWQAFLFKSVIDALARGERSVVLDEKQVDALDNASTQPLSPMACCVLQALDPGPEQSGPAWVLNGLAAISASLYFGRFCHLDDAMRERVQALLSRGGPEGANDTDAIVAEVVHLPPERQGNVIIRPPFSEYEIVYLANGSVAHDKQIVLDDLMLSLKDNEFVLRSRRLNRRIIPRLSCAHNVDLPNAHVVYRFLGQLQHQGIRAINQQLPSVIGMLEFVPRVVYRNIVLYGARWLIKADTIAALKKASFEGRQAAVGKLRQELQWPRFVAYHEADNVMPIDLDNPLLVDTLVELLPASGDGQVHEAAGGLDDTPLQGPDGHYTNEIVLPLLRQAPPATTLPEAGTDAAAKQPAPPLLADDSDVVHLPGSQWLYAKIYCGQSVADDLLREVIDPLVRRLRDEGAIRSWFFIRYADPGYHLRVRFAGDPDRLHLHVLPALRDALQSRVQGGVVHTFQLDAYRPEVTRYGGPAAYSHCYQMFEHDSDTVLRIVALTTELGAAADTARWYCACVATHQWLSAAWPDEAQRLDAVRQLNQGMRARFRPSKAQDGAIGERFRAHRKALEHLLTGTGPASDPVMQEARLVLAQRQLRWMEPLAQLQSLRSDGTLAVPWVDLVGSVAHMGVNRMLRNMQVPQECLVYDWLERMYSSWMIRTRAGTAPDLAMSA